MLWKTTKGNFLVQKNLAPVPFINGGFGLPNGERFYESAEFYEITSSGNVSKKYGKPESINNEGKLIVSAIHRVVEDTLYHFYWSQLSGHAAEILVDKRVRKLQPYAGSLPFDLDAVIAAYEQAAILPTEDQPPTQSQPAAGDVLENAAENAYRLFEMDVLHQYIDTITYYDRDYAEEVTVPREQTMNRHIYLAVPSEWYNVNAFSESVKNKIYEAIGESLLKKPFWIKHVSLDFKEITPSTPNADDEAKTKWGYHFSKHHFQIFSDNYSCKEVSLPEYKEFLIANQVSKTARH